MKFRWLNKLYANLFGYFWLPCPLCNQHFGGHEWGMYDTLVTGGSENNVYGTGVCPDCGEKARKLNAERSNLIKEEQNNADTKNAGY